MNIFFSLIFIFGAVAGFFIFKFVIEFLIKKVNALLKRKGIFIFRIFLYSLVFSLGRLVNVFEVVKNKGVMPINFPWGDWIFLGSRTYFSVGDFLQFGGIVAIILGILIHFFDARYGKKNNF